MSTSATALARETAPLRLSIAHVATGAADRSALVGDRLSKAGFDVSTTSSLTAAGDRIAETVSASGAAMAVVELSDERPAMAAIRGLRARFATLAIVAVTDPSRPLLAAEALQAGASDVLSWPFHSADIAGLSANVVDTAAVSPPAADVEPVDRLIAQSAAMRQVADLARAASAGNGSVFCLGESGSGRETVARAVHAASGRSHGPFVVVNGAEGQADELEVRLFGSIERQSASRNGAPDRVGSTSALVRANGGTLLVKQLAAVPARLQARLARLTRDGEALVGDSRDPVALDIRLAATGDEAVDAALADGHLRRDLYDRVAQTRIAVPSLRRRREDIPVLAALMLRDLSGALGSSGQQFSRAALTLLSALPFPGNGRDLRALVETLVHAVEQPVIQIDDVLAHTRLDGGGARVDGAGTLRDARARFEREWISAALMKHQGRVEDAAKALGIQRTNLYRKIRQLNVARALLVRKS